MISESVAALPRSGSGRHLSAGLLQQSRLSIPYCLSGKVLSGMDRIEDDHGEEDRQSIEDDEQSLVGDDRTIPTLEELDGSVDASNKDDGRAEDHSGNENLAVLDISW